MTAWTVSRDQVLTANEIQLILSELKRKARRSANTAQNLILFRLACCCGLRVSELTSLRLCDVRLGTRPTLKVLGKAPRVVSANHQIAGVPMFRPEGSGVWIDQAT